MSAGPRPAAPGCLYVLLALGIPLIYGNVMMIRQVAQSRQLAQHGQVIEAQVIKTGTAPGPRSLGRNYGVEYLLPISADASGQRHHADVTQNTYQRAVDFGKIEVRYLPDQPNVQRAVGAVSGWSSGIILVLFDLIFLALLFIVYKGA